jgi:hypothetical protein
MSIALTGPSKYDFQDLVCINYILKFYKLDSAGFIVEPKGGEDAEFEYVNEEGQQLRFEIQVKGSEEPVTLAVVAECLGHFPARGDTDFLLERLVENKNSRVVLVMSGRASDSVLKYLPKAGWNGEVHKTKLKNTDAICVLSAVKKYSDSLTSTNQNIRRQKYIDDFCKVTCPKIIKEALSRLIIIESESNSFIYDDCRKILRKDFNVPDDMFDDTMNRLSMIIKNEKLNENNAIPAVLKKIDDNSVISVRPSRYVQRSNEGDWVDFIRKNNYILLSGKPRVGKSNTARWLASSFQDQGYSVLLTQHVDEAERFLLDSVIAPRVVVLDDPLGGIIPISKPNATLYLLKRLVTDLRPNRKLIVAQGQERLLDITESERLSDASFGTVNWVDLNFASSEFLIRYWEALRTEFSIPDGLFKLIHDEIKNNSLFVEPGCLAYLASDFKKIGSHTDLDRVLRFARRDAFDLGRSLSEEGCKDILIGLAITTSHLEPVKDVDLAFALTSSEAIAYGHSTILGTSIGKISDDETSEFPKYLNEPELTANDLDSLELLGVRKIIDVNDRNLTIFNHPFYRSAAESLFSFNSKHSFEKIEKILTNGLFCLSPATARASARNFHWIYEKAKRIDEKNKIIDLARSGLNSSYPSTRDICFEFLIDIYPSLEGKYKEEQSGWIQKVNGYDLSTLKWHEGQPWFPMGKHVTLELNFFGSGKGDDSICETIKIVQAINNNEEIFITPEDAYNVLIYLEFKPKELTSNIISRMLSISEGIIRALAVKVWMKLSREKDENILARIFRDKHPAVAKSVFKSSILSWNTFSSKRQGVILNGLKEIAVHPVLAYTIINDLILFERPNEMGENPPWKVFSDLMPIVLSSLPLNFRLNFGRLSCVMDEAIKILDTDSILLIIDSWITLLEKIAFDKVPDDYELAVTNILMEVSLLNTAPRIHFIRRLLLLNGTGPRVRVISDLVGVWDILSKEEKVLIVELVSSDGEDKYWFRSAVLTAWNQPDELVKIILPNHPTGILKVKDAISIEPALLKPVIQMYVGEPQPLWWLATHHREKNIWSKVIELIASKPSHFLFDIAFNFILNKRDCEQLIKIIKSSDEQYLSVIFELMFQHKFETNGDFMPEVWHELFLLVQDDNVKSNWIKRMVSIAPEVIDCLDEAEDWIPSDYLPEFYSYFSSDNLVFNFLNILWPLKDKITKNSTDGIRADMLQRLSLIFLKTPPLHYGTCGQAHKILKSLGYTSEETAFVESKRVELVKSANSLEIKVESEEISNWIF